MQLELRRRLLASSALIAASMLGSAALAQDTGATQTADVDADNEATIVVTGSLITNPNLERSTPVNVTTSEEVELRQTNVAEQLLREIPGVVPSTGSAVNNGNGGASFVNLRGLGSNRNIVLLDGVRIVPSSLVGRVDLNNIPLALIERTEVLTGGASTTYGADAVGGVVNFITKQDFSGIEIQASEQITEQGDGNIFRIDATIGASFDDSRGNAVFSIGYQEADPVYQGARDFSRFSFDPFIGSVGGSGLAPTPSRFANISTTGADFISTDCGEAGQVACATAVQGVRQITAAGGAFRPSGAFDPFNFNPLNIFQTPFERFNIFGQANYEVTDGIAVYTRGLFSKNTVSTIAAPSGAFGIGVTVSLNNPLLTPAQRNAFCAFDTNTGPGYTPLFSPAVCAAAGAATGPADPAYRTANTTLFRRASEFGPRVSDFVTQIFDYRIGIRGDITSTITFDVFGAYGETENLQNQQGYYLDSRTRQSLLAGPGGCNDSSNGCIPVNFFGPDGGITPAQNAFLTANSTIQNIVSLAQARATISGDFGASSPWADDPISFAVGGEYRQYRASIQSDSLTQSGDLAGAGGATPNVDGSFDVYEAFGELVAPLVQDEPFFQSLTLEAGARYSHYTVDSAGASKFNTTTWKVGGSWEPVDSIKFRGNYSRAVRAPNISELFTPVVTGLTSLQNDPCASTDEFGASLGRPIPSGTLRAVCLAQGAPAATIGVIPQPAAGQANVTIGGNLDLKPEKSTSYTFGVVVQPEFLPGFALSIDYYNIKVTGAISAPTPDDAILACFGGGQGLTPAAGAETTAACRNIRRDQGTGSVSGDPAVTAGIIAALSNLGTIKTDGIDVTMNYNTDLHFAKLALSFAGNWTNSSSFRATPVSLNRECVAFYSGNCGSPGGAAADVGSIQPEFSWTQRTTLTVGNIDLSLLWRHLSSVQYEPGLLPRAYVGPVPSSQSPLPGSPTPGAFGNRDFNFIESHDYFDLATRIGVGDNLTLTVTVANLLDKKPPLVGTSIGTASFNSGNTYPSTYDALGRSFRVGARVRF